MFFFFFIVYIFFFIIDTTRLRRISKITFYSRIHCSLPVFQQEKNYFSNDIWQRNIKNEEKIFFILSFLKMSFNKLEKNVAISKISFPTKLLFHIFIHQFPIIARTYFRKVHRNWKSIITKSIIINWGNWGIDLVYRENSTSLI